MIYGVYGAGGHGCEAMQVFRSNLHLVQESNLIDLFFVETDPISKSLNDVQIISEEVFLRKIDFPLNFTVAIADPNVRETISNRMSSFDCTPFPIISTLASISKESEIGTAPIFSQFSLVSPNVKIGNFVHLNYFSSVSHDSSIGNFVTIGPGARINGHILVEDNVYVGAQATVLPGTRDKKRVIGKGATIGMGAVVIDDVPPFVTVVGNPARILEN